MNCNKSIRLWKAFVSGDLRSKQRERLNSHLDECERCRQQKSAFELSQKQAVEWLSQSNEMTTEEWARMLDALPQAQARSNHVPLGLLLGGATAVVAMILILVLAHPAQLGSDGKDGGAAPNQLSAASTKEDIAPRSDPDRYEVRLSTSDPKVKIVWVFDRNLDLNH